LETTSSGIITPLPALDDREFKRLSTFIERELGIRMPDTKRVMLESRLQKRLRLHGYTSYRDYVDYVFSDEGSRTEMINMIDAVTTNKTDFFREADHFEFLQLRILPQLVERANGQPLRFWSAGCSTGEEPYTLAMVLADYGLKNPRMDYRILATDISTRVLDAASRAIYDLEKTKPIPLDLKKKYLLKSKDPERAEVRIRPELRSKVSFSRVNFMDDEYPVPKGFDTVFCRNVIIYFDRKTQERILGHLCDHIQSGGWLLIGHSETLTGMDLPLRSMAPTIYQRE
jgi:chemotaxis protein methyltransferase CheR